MNQRQKNQLARLHKYLQALQQSDNHPARHFANDVQWFEDYAEPGYAAPEAGILTGNWNDLDSYDRQTGQRAIVSTVPSRFADLCERVGLSLEWLDEWTCCDDCGLLVRIQPDCWHWQPSYRLIGDCVLYCLDCYAKNHEEEDG